MPYKTKRRPSVSRRLKIITLVSLVLATVLAIGALYLKQQETIAENAAAAESFNAAQPASAAPEEAAKVVSVLSDSHAFNEGSWWRRTVVAGTVEGVTDGAFESQPGAETSSLIPRLDAAAEGADFVVVQAGTNDLLSAKTPGEAAAGVFELWDGVVERDAEPIATLVPPSDSRPAEAVELNELIRAEAEARGIPVVDVYTPVAAEDGSWVDGFTDDGVHANAAGSERMTEAAQAALASILS